MFLSFIVPVYNAEAYLAQCLGSLLDQDIPAQDYEILCVNDGSRDGSPEILRTFAGKHLNIVVIDKENGGVAAARNAGLEAARGDYIWFVDADDFLKPKVLGALREKAESSRCDRLIVGGYQFTDNLTGEEAELSRLGQLPINAPWYDSVVWRGLLRREFLQANGLCFRYPELTHGEDGLFQYELGLCRPESVEVPEVLYFYRVHSGSAETAAGRDNQSKKLRSYLRITEILQGYYRSGRTDGTTADKLMSFLWFSLYEAAKLPAEERKPVLRQLHQAGLYPCRRPPQCTLERSYLTDRTDGIGRILDFLYLHLHTRWGFTLVRILQQARNRL